MLYLLPEDDFQLESRETLKRGNKTEEEIKKYTLDEDLGEVKRTILLLSKGDPIQRRAIIQSLPTVIDHYPNILSTVMSTIKEIMPLLDPQLQNTLVEQIVELVPIVSEETLLDLTRMALTHLQQWKNQKLSLGWLKLFGIMVTKPTFPQMQQKFVQLALKLSESKEILPMKMVSVRMIGHLSFHMKNRLKGTPLDRIRTFCRDPDKEMRLIVLRQVMPRLFQNLGIELINIYFMEKIFEMIYDFDIEVKVAAIELLLEFYNILSVEDKERYAKIVIQHLQSPEYFPHLSLKTGDIYLKIRFQLERKSEMGSFINCFIQHLASEDPIVRYNSLYNLPGLLMHMGLKIWSDVRSLYSDILLREEALDVKKMAVSIYHEVVKLMQLTDFEDFPNLTLSMIKSLDIEPEDILFCFLEGFPQVFEVLKRVSLELQCNQKDNSYLEKIIKNIENYTLEILKALLGPHPRQSINHYLMAKFYSTIGQCIRYMNHDTITDVYFPIVLEGLKRSNGIVLEPLLESVYQLFYQLVGKVEILPLISQLNKLLCQANSSAKIVYIKLAAKLLVCFSVQKYKEFGFFDNCARFVQDKVLSVRMQLVVYMQSASIYFPEADQIIKELFQSKEVSKFMKREFRVQTEEQKHERRRRNSQCLKNEQMQLLVTSKRRIDQDQPKKKNFIIKTAPVTYKKSIMKCNPGSKNLASSSTSSHSLVPSIVNTNRSQLKIKINEEAKEISKSIRKIIHNKVAPETEKLQTQKRKFQSVEISFYKNKIAEQTRKRRKTIIQKKEGNW